MFAVDETSMDLRPQPVLTETEKGAVRRLALAHADTEACCLDEEAGRTAGYRSRRAPPTFAGTLGRNPPFCRMMPRAGTIHDLQPVVHGAPIVAHAHISVRRWLKHPRVRSGSWDRMTLVTGPTEGANHDEMTAVRARTGPIVTNEAPR